MESKPEEKEIVYPTKFLPYNTYADYLPTIENLSEGIVDGVYTLQGPQNLVINKMSEPLNIGSGSTTQLQFSEIHIKSRDSQGLIPMQTADLVKAPSVPGQSQTMVQANIQVSGEPTSEGRSWFVALWMIFVSVLIVPVIFMYCVCWKKFVSPMIQLDIEFYRTLGAFLRRHKEVKVFNVTVVDNAFGAEKAKVLHENLARASLTSFTFKNVALPCSHKEDEYSSFAENMTPLKSLPFTTSFTWEDTTV